MDKRIVLATGNPGKLKEIGEILKPAYWEVVPQSAFAVADADETGLTFVENAIIKARHASQQTGLPALADDSGLEVDALNGQPGIYSARYGGIGASSQDNIDKLLDAMSEFPAHQRNARFWCVMVYLKHANDPCPIICQGAWEGSITTAQSGSNGFGYDPVFKPNGFDCSAAELTPTQKNEISHRAQALRSLKEKLVITASKLN